MYQPSLSGIVRRRFIHCIADRGLSAGEVVSAIGLPPADLCKLIAGQVCSAHRAENLWCVARWLNMSVKNVALLAGQSLRLDELIALGMRHEGFRPNSSQDQLAAAQRAGISVAVFRRALHGYPDFRPSLRTCNLLARWLAWTGYDVFELAHSAGVRIQHLPNGRVLTTSVWREGLVGPYPCACGRSGCFVPAHFPTGPRRIWRSDACRMWAKRCSTKMLEQSHCVTTAPLPHRPPIVRFILINERAIPARF